MRRQFDLPEADEAHLESLGRPWETIHEGPARWLLVHEWPVSAGYNHSAVSIAIRIEPGYPDTQLDMVYVLPHLGAIQEQVPRFLVDSLRSTRVCQGG